MVRGMRRLQLVVPHLLGVAVIRGHDGAAAWPAERSGFAQAPSSVSTAAMVASRLPVWPTMSAFAKLQMTTSWCRAVEIGDERVRDSHARSSRASGRRSRPSATAPARDPLPGRAPRAAVEEVGDVRVFLGFREPQVGPPVLGEDVGEVAREASAARTRPAGPNVRSYTVIVVKLTRGRAGRSKPSNSSSAIARVSWRARSARKLKKTTESPSRSVRQVRVGVDDDDRLDELVGDPASCDARTAFRRVRSVARRAADDGVVGELGPLPALVAIHRVVAPRHGGDPSAPAAARTSSSCADVADAAGRRRVAAVGDRVNEHAGKRVRRAAISISACR